MQISALRELVELGYIERPANWEDQPDVALTLLESPMQAPFLIAARMRQTVDHWANQGVDLTEKTNYLGVLATLYPIGLEGSRGVNDNPENSPRGDETVATLRRMGVLLYSDF